MKEYINFMLTNDNESHFYAFSLKGAIFLS
jgi:hypothetical protein